MIKKYLFFLVLSVSSLAFAQSEPINEESKNETASVQEAPAAQVEVAKPTSAPAATVKQPSEVKYTIKQIIKSKNMVVVESSEETDFKDGKIFLASFADGSQCSLELQEIDKKHMAFDSSDCKQVNLTLSTPVEPSLLKEGARFKSVTSGAEGSVNAKIRTPFSVNVYYSAANDLQFKNGRLTTATASGDVDTTLSSDTSMGLGVNFTRVNDHSWGLTGSLMYEPGRKISSAKVTGSGGTVSGSFNTRPELALVILEGGMIYKWEKAYMPLALNYSAPILTYSSTSEIWDVAGAFGIYAGCGYFITENSAIEGFVRSIGVQSKVTSGTTTIDFKTGYLTGFGFGYKYYF